jgi:thiol-disulfide isomerase/thioredoxin
MALALAAGAARAADPPSSPELAALVKEFQEAQKNYAQEPKVQNALKAVRAAKTDEEREAAQKGLEAVRAGAPQYADRFIEFARKHSNDPSAFSALILALQFSGGPAAKNGAWDKIIGAVEADYATSPQVMRIVRLLGQFADPASEKLLRAVVAKNTDHKVQGRAVKVLIDRHDNADKMVEQFADNEALRKNLERGAGKEFVAQLLAYAKQSKEETPKLKTILGVKYADVFPDLSVGKPVPEVVSQGLDGKEVRLSALKGKVVVLDIWATWCPPCRAMIPHEREMVERLKGKPFVLVSVNCDADKKTLTSFLAKESMPWTHWWNGAEGGIVEEWDVQGFPTIYVLDAKGVIRSKDVRDAELEKAVNELLKEMETKK